MPSGGARMNSGPPPDPEALRRDRKNEGEWLVLSADGRTGKTPEWPLAEASPGELNLWYELWFKPQAIEWERLGQERLVARYVRTSIQAEALEAPAALGTLVLRMEHELFLTRASLAHHRIRIEQVDPPKIASAKRRSTSKSRLRVVAADAVEGTDPAG